MLQDNNIIDKSKLNSDTKLYKYMDLEKFLSLIVKNEICFCKQSVLKNIDIYEGALRRDEKIKEYLIQEMVERVKSVDTFKYLEICNDIDNIIIDLSENIKFKPDTEKNYYINCWHTNDYESLAMWKVFSNNKNSIAISTTKDNLIASIINDEEKIYIKEVEYFDLLKQEKEKFRVEPNTKDNITLSIKSDAITNIYNNKLFRKSKYYAYEQELRLVLKSDNNEDDVKFVKVDLNSMINDIIISPNCDKWFLDILKEILNKYNINKKINYSKITDDNISLSDKQVCKIKDKINDYFRNLDKANKR